MTIASATPGANRVVKAKTDGKIDSEWLPSGGGSGGGNVIGPATNTNNKVPQWDGNDSDTLKDGLTIVTTVGTPGADTTIPTEQAVREAIAASGGGDVSGPTTNHDSWVPLWNGLNTKFLKDGFLPGDAASKNTGTASGTLCAGDDSRLSNARTPTAHVHAATDVTSGTLDGDRLPAMSTGKAGAVPATGTPLGKYLRDDGTFNTPTGAGDTTGPASSTDNAVSRFDGVGGKTLQNSLTTIDDNGSVNIPTGQKYKIANTALAYGDVGAAASSHAHAATDITSATLDGDRLPAISTTKKGAVPLTGAPSGKYLKDDGTWTALPGAGIIYRALTIISSTFACSGTSQEVVYLTSSGGSARDITDITGDVDGAVIDLLFNDAHLTVKHNLSYIKLRGAVDLTPNAGDILSLVSKGGVWWERFRSLF